MQQNDLKPLPEPVGKFIIEQTDIEPCVALDGSWWHYNNVITLMKRFSEKENATLRARAELMEQALEQIRDGAAPCNEFQAFSWIDTARGIANEALEQPAEQPIIAYGKNDNDDE